jgi:hypothetical protein
LDRPIRKDETSKDGGDDHRKRLPFQNVAYQRLKRARYLVPAAILEAGSLKSLVGYILEGQTFSVVVAAVLAGFILSDWPIQPTPTDTQSRDFA